MTTTFVNRQNTNHAVISKANETIKREDKNKKIKPFRQIYQDVKTKRLAKIILQEPTVSERRISFQSDLNAWDYGNKRVGRPKTKWVEDAIRELWTKALKGQSTIAHNTQIDRQNPAHTQLIRHYSTTLIS